VRRGLAVRLSGLITLRDLSFGSEFHHEVAGLIDGTPPAIGSRRGLVLSQTLGYCGGLSPLRVEFSRFSQRLFDAGIGFENFDFGELTTTFDLRVEHL